MYFFHHVFFEQLVNLTSLYPAEAVLQNLKLHFILLMFGFQKHF